MKREQELAQMAECSFQPNLVSNREGSQSRSAAMINKNKFNSMLPIHERVHIIQKEKNERLQKLRVQAEEDQAESVKFRPEINTRSEKIAQYKQDSEIKNANVVDRLYNDASSRIERNMKSQMSIRSVQNQSMMSGNNDAYTFHPAISDASKVLAEKNDLYQGDYKDFQTRQTEFIERQREKREALRNQYADEAVYKFKPQINVMSDVICQSDPNRGFETKDQAIERLYSKEMVKKKVKTDLLEQEVYKDLTFKPKINQISARIAPDTSIVDRSQNYEGVKRKEQLKQEH